jgi:phosphomannomutase
VPNGLFPHHVPDPMKEENITDLKKKVLEEEVDLGIAIDGDADRVFFVDKKGRRPDGVYTGVLLAKYLLKKEKNKKIIHDPRITWPFLKEVAAFKAEAYQSIAGHAYFKKKMVETGALFGAEASSHFYYHDFYNCDSAMITIAIMLNMYFEEFELTKAVDYLFEKYPNAGEVNYTVKNAGEMLKKLEDHYSRLGAKIEHIDGVSINFDDWRFNLRMSNTQPLIRLNLEAVNKALVIEKFHEVEALIGTPRDNSPILPELI